MKKQSLVQQLILRLLAATGLALAASGGLLLWQFNHSTQIILDRGLGETMEQIRRGLSLDPSGKLVASLPDDLVARFNEEFYFTVGDEHGESFLSVPAGIEHSYHPFETDLGEKPQFFEHNYPGSGENYLGVTARIILDKREFWVQLVEEVPYWENFLNYSVEVFIRGVGVLIVLHFLGSAFLSYRALRASFRSVEAAAQQAREIVPGKRDIRIGIEDLPAEIRPFAEAINAALDRLERALAAQKRFTADAAHELLTPLAVIRADIETIDDRRVATALSTDVEEMSGIVAQLLELSELEAEGSPPDELCDLRQIAGDVLMKLAPLAIAKGIEAELTGAEEPVRVRGSPRTLNTALANLIRNVIAHATGATRLEVSVRHGGRVLVIDDGPGVPPELRERIFERFHRVHRNSERGRGLGLAIVRRIIEAHAGRVYVTDGPGGKGAAFVIELPNARTQAPKARANA